MDVSFSILGGSVVSNSLFREIYFPSIVYRDLVLMNWTNCVHEAAKRRSDSRCVSTGFVFLLLFF